MFVGVSFSLIVLKGKTADILILPIMRGLRDFDKASAFAP
jgi:hypothetical protein